MANTDLVLEGGGIKGIALVGAVFKLMEKGYEFPRLAGTSAGSIVASFLAAGASKEQLVAVMDNLDYSRVPDRAWPGIPVLSEGESLMLKAGAYRGHYVHAFLEEELAKLGVKTFKDLIAPDDPQADPRFRKFHRYKLMVTATDVTNGRLLRLPWDYELLGLDPDQQSVATAVRASMSIPLYFEPVKIKAKGGKEVVLVDGGVLSNFPIQAFDRTDGKEPRWPTFGVKIIPNLPADMKDLFPTVPGGALPPLDMLERVAATAIVGHDQTYLERPCVQRRTIEVDTSEIGIVEFDAPPEKRETVRTKGEAAADSFLAGWDWASYKRSC
ncbi:MAG TPA: patatin-like phospholipase family protein [Solirubrobacterales bacterium]|nr:patatin-like phospholipase family protein [Solirubrobacterales bacterium]